MRSYLFYTIRALFIYKKTLLNSVFCNIKIYFLSVIPKAFFTTSTIISEPIANTTNTVPITQAIIAFFATPVLSGAPADKRYKIPATIQPITTIGVAIAIAALLTASAMDFNVAPSADANNGIANTTTKISIDNIFLFTYF